MPVFHIGNAELRTDTRQLIVDGADAPVGSRAFDLLVVLVQERDRLVGKSELLDRVWPNLVVEENNLQVHISTLRKLLGAKAIATVPGRGYRFSAPVTEATAARPPAAVAPRPAVPAPRPLPAAGEPIIGRDAELDALVERVRNQRLVTVLGAGGMGKTRLALAAAVRLAPLFADGTCVVDLATVQAAAEVPAHVGRAMGVQLPAGDAVAGLVDRLGQSPALLLVLDNCEHLVAAVADLAQALLAAVPGLHLLATSQEPLQLSTEQQWRLGPLGLPPEGERADPAAHAALALFVERVRAQQGRLELDDATLADAADIVRRLDGVPLAIELAAARVPLLGVAGVRQHLDERLRLLTTTARDVPARQRTLRAMLDWSHALLGPTEQRVFRRLGVFTGSFGLDLAQAVAAGEELQPWEVLDVLGTLVDKSLLFVLPGEAPRYRLLESARAYALDQLQQSGEGPALRRAHANALRQVLGLGLRGAMQGRTTLDQFCAAAVPEIDNLRAAVAWAAGPEGELPLAVDLVNLASALMYQTGRYVECCDWMLALEPRLPADLPERTRATFVHGLALVGIHTLPAGRRATLIEQACDTFRRTGPPQALVTSLCLASWIHSARGQPELAMQRLDEAAAVMGPDAAADLRVMWLFNRGVVHRMSDRMDQAGADFQACLPLARRSGQARWVFNSLANIGLVAHEHGLLDEALRWYDELLRFLRGLPFTDPEMWAFSLAWTLRCLAARGDLATARARLVELLPHARRSLSLRYFGDALAELAARQGRWQAALMLVGADDAARERREEPREATHRRAVEQVIAAAVAAGHAGDLERWRLEGRTLDEDGAHALALGS
ncbi:MAG: winged helix-turn-helix domain-containing protein [Rubrivivax sp.]|nr:winged helix-turn-helix domain-containing protein [Rubrivivax sp.]